VPKIRAASRLKERRAIKAIRDYCDTRGLIFQAEPIEDYGVDCYIEVADAQAESHPRNFLVGIQSKCGPSYVRSAKSDGRFKIRLDQRDLDYWLAANYPILLIYYDEERDCQYFKHIQREWETTPTQSRLVTFSPTDLVDGENLARYLRVLMLETPNARSRLEVIRGALQVEVLCQRTNIQPVEGKRTNILRSVRCFRQQPTIGKQVIAFSKNSRFVIEGSRWHVGQTGFAMESLTVVDFHGLRAVEFPIVTTEDLDEYLHQGKEVPARVTDARLRAFAQQVKGLDFCEPRTLLALTQPEEMEEGNVTTRLFLGSEQFDVALDSDDGIQTLRLKNSKYRPTRVASLLVERSEVVYDPSLEVQFPIVPRIPTTVTGVSISHCGERIALTLVTNAENGCWGNRSSHIVHYSLRRIREACRLALL
jgi:hypothetical protein